MTEEAADRLNRLLLIYIKHVGTCEGVTFLRSRYRGCFQGSHEEWEALRQMAGETE